MDYYLFITYVDRWNSLRDFPSPHPSISASYSPPHHPISPLLLLPWSETHLTSSSTFSLLSLLCLSPRFQHNLLRKLKPHLGWIISESDSWHFAQRLGKRGFYQIRIKLLSHARHWTFLNSLVNYNKSFFHLPCIYPSTTLPPPLNLSSLLSL